VAARGPKALQRGVPARTEVERRQKAPPDGGPPKCFFSQGPSNQGGNGNGEGTGHNGPPRIRFSRNYLWNFILHLSEKRSGTRTLHHGGAPFSAPIRKIIGQGLPEKPPWPGPWLQGRSPPEKGPFSRARPLASGRRHSFHQSPFTSPPVSENEDASPGNRGRACKKLPAPPSPKGGNFGNKNHNAPPASVPL